MTNGKSKEQFVVGLDIGTTKVCCVVAKRDEFGKINILGVGKSVSEGMQHAQVVNINKTVESIKDAVAEASHTSSIKIKGVNVGISGEHVQCIKSNAEVSINPTQIVNYQDVVRLVEKAERNFKHLGVERKVIHTIPQEFVVDDQEGVVDPIGMAGQSTMRGSVYVVMGMITKIRNIEQCIERAGLAVNGMTFEPIASGLAVIKESERRSGVVVVDIGGGTTDIAIYTRGVIRHSEVVKVAGTHVTNDVAIGLRTLDNVAEDLKIRHGCAYSRDLMSDEEILVQGIEGRTPKSFMRSALTNIIEARMTEIFEMVRSSLKRSGYYEYLNAGAIITGGGALVQGTQGLAQDVLGLDVRIGHPEGLSGGMVNDLSSPMYATAVGLVLRALRDNHQDESTAETEPKPIPIAIIQTDSTEEKEPDKTILSKLKNWFDQI
jgi:cell division protein FtsA